MKKIFVAICAFAILAIEPLCAFAQENTVTPIDIKASKEIIAQYNKSPQKDVTIESLEQDVVLLNQLQTKARDCIANVNIQLGLLNDLIESTHIDSSESALREDHQYLIDKKKLQTNTLSDCKLLLYHSEEVLVKVRDRLAEENASQMLKRTPAIWTMLSPKRLTGLSESINVHDLSSVNWHWQYYAVLIVVLLLLAFITLKTQGCEAGEKRFSVDCLLLERGARYAIYLTIWLIMVLIIRDLLGISAANEPAQVLVDGLLFIFTGGLSLYLVRHFKSDIQERFEAMSVASIFSTMLMVMLGLLMIIESFGYHYLALFITSGIVLSLVVVTITSTVQIGIDTLYQHLQNVQYSLARNLRYFLGLKLHREIHEITLLKYLAHTVVIATSGLILLYIWGTPPNVHDAIMDALFEGTRIARFDIVPLNVLIGGITFALLMLAGRLVATLAARENRFKGEFDTQVAISSIILYLTFAIATLISLVIIGVNFTGIAIIAGALSVGIGLGLQTIVNNFVSGIILLLEKPIKPGDRIIIGETEGFVKKVRLRSTQITTLAREDVIVPNADLITHQVTNYMFRDPTWRVVCQVGVAYGSPVELVKKVLLEDVAAHHPDVLQEQPNHPTVLFRSFGDSSLLFELWCIINDVNKKFVIVSDLNFAINQAFAEHNITIAFPQRDVHIKQAPVQETP